MGVNHIPADKHTCTSCGKSLKKTDKLDVKYPIARIKQIMQNE